MKTKSIKRPSYNKTQKKRKLSKNKKMEIIKTFLEILNYTKLHHWSTNSYSEHKATDELYSDLNKYIDEFVEIMLGKDKERIYSIESIGAFKVKNKNQFITKINAFKYYLINLNEFMDKLLDTNLINIRDELLGTLDKLLYLFELK
jgi:DNA-binding ferritin-like protein